VASQSARARMQAPHAVLRAQGWYYRRALRWTEGQSATEAVHLCSRRTISCGLCTPLGQQRPYTPGPVCSEKSRVGQIYRSDVQSAYRRPVQHRCRARRARRRRPVLCCNLASRSQVRLARGSGGARLVLQRGALARQHPEVTHVLLVSPRPPSLPFNQPAPC
jgi:hypothetical protein